MPTPGQRYLPGMAWNIWRPVFTTSPTVDEPRGKKTSHLEVCPDLAFRVKVVLAGREKCLVICIAVLLGMPNLRGYWSGIVKKQWCHCIEAMIREIRQLVVSQPNESAKLSI